jgi:hypothetical protein
VDRAVTVLDRIDKPEGTEAPRRWIVNVVDADTLYEMITRIERETDELERQIAARELATIEAPCDVSPDRRHATAREATGAEVVSVAARDLGRVT